MLSIIKPTRLLNQKYWHCNPFSAPCNTMSQIQEFLAFILANLMNATISFPLWRIVVLKQKLVSTDAVRIYCTERTALSYPTRRLRYNTERRRRLDFSWARYYLISACHSTSRQGGESGVMGWIWGSSWELQLNWRLRRRIARAVMYWEHDLLWKRRD